MSTIRSNIEDIQVPLFHVELVRDRTICARKCIPTNEAAQIAHDVLDRSPVEKLMVMYVDAGGFMVGAEIVAVGQLESCHVSPSEIFRGALIAGVPRIIVAHNHPSGDTTPSQPDIHLTTKLAQAGVLLGVEVFDHVVVSPNGTHTSIYDYAQELVKKQLRKTVNKRLTLTPDSIAASEKQLSEYMKQY